MNEYQAEKLIIKHLSGENSHEEDKILLAWISDSPGNRQLFQFHKSVWTETKVEFKNTNPDQVYDEISDKIHFSVSKSKSLSSSVWFRLPPYVRAASIVIIVVIGLGVWHALYNQEPERILTTNLVDKAAMRGQKLKTFLPDGSVAWLNGESKITYSEFFSDTMRLVSLEGEAYFEVEKDPLRPFIVELDGLEIIALGTAFSVRSYHSDDNVSVALEYGRVLVKMRKNNHTVDQVILEPGNGIDYNLKDQTYVQALVKPDEAFNWREGVLYFENASFHEVLSKLSRWYGVDFVVENYKNKPWNYTATFRNFYLKEVLQSMSFTKDFKYTIQPDNKIIIHFKN